MTCTILTAGEELLEENKNENEPPYPQIKSKLHDLIGSLLCGGYDSFYVNCEYGIPLWAAELIGELKHFNDIVLHLVIPYEEQAVKWEEDKRERYFRVHERADSVTMANTQYHPECYHDAEKMMINESDLIVICGEENSLPEAASYAASQKAEVCYYPVL